MLICHPHGQAAHVDDRLAYSHLFCTLYFMRHMKRKNKLDVIDRKAYPFLDRIMWDNKKQKLTLEEAFYFCETRYGYYVENQLSKKENKLLNTLIAKVGRGIFLHA